MPADITVLGKYFAGGLSFGAFGGSAQIMAAFDPERGGITHGGTFNNNLFSMSVGVALSGLLDAATLARLNERGDRLRDRLNAVLSQIGFCATGIGSMLTIHPVPGPVTSWSDVAGADPRRRQLLFHELLHRGYYVAQRGYLALSLAVTDEQLDGFVASIDDIAGEFRSILD